MAGFADRTLGDVLAALASDAPSPGSGVAAAVTLAFAAACAAKALAISRKHRPLGGDLLTAEQRLTAIIHRSLTRADVDARLFEEFIHHRSEKTADELILADESTQSLVSELGATLDEIAGSVHPVVEGDIAAARTLLEAAKAIEQRIRTENRRSVVGAHGQQQDDGNRHP